MSEVGGKMHKTRTKWNNNLNEAKQNKTKIN